MDSVSHALIGLAVAGLSGHQPAVSDPVYIAAVLGAQAPDFDIIARLWGKMAFLRQHRAFSHSLPGIVLWATAIGAGLSFFMPQAGFFQVLPWALAGGLSHTIIDYFNTHGTAILWPLRKERKSQPLLNVFDPLLLAAMLSLYAFNLSMLQISLLTFAVVALYILSRLLLRRQAVARLEEELPPGAATKRLWVMPSLRRLFSWDFVVETENRHLNGRLDMLYPVPEIQADLPKNARGQLIHAAQKTSLGKFFRTFTPFIYFEEHSTADAAQVNIYDLRYYAGEHFIHSATIVFDRDNMPCAAYMHTPGDTVKIG